MCWRERAMDGIIARAARWAAGLLCVLLWAHATRSQNHPSPDSIDPQVSVRLSTDRTHFQPGEDIRLHVEIWNEGDRDLFIYRNIDAVYSNALATIDLTLYAAGQRTGRSVAITGDSFSSERANYPPLLNELPRYWILLPPQRFYGQEVVMRASWFNKLSIPGKYRIQGKYRSRGFLAQDINNPLLHYAEELKGLPYKAWVGEVETNSIWIEVAKQRTTPQPRSPH